MLVNTFMLGEKNRYVSVLKQKAGERDAVAKLANLVWDEWNPLFELLSDDELDDDTIKQKSIHAVKNSCKAGALVFLDFDDIAELPAALLTEILATLEQEGIMPVPVATLSSPPHLLTVFRNYIATRGNRIGVRIYFNEIDNNIIASVTQLINSLALDVQVSHLFFDLDHINEDYLAALTVAVPITASQIPHLSQWDTVTVVGTGFPKVLEVPGASNAVLPRTEWELWLSAKGQLSPSVKRMDFGDYAISHPELVDFDPIRMQISAKIIYTTDDAWFVYKGRSVRKLGFQQTHAMCAHLIQRPEFKGLNFSDGDKYIVDCANQTASCGNSTTWKRVGTNHHITLVAHQVANQP